MGNIKSMAAGLLVAMVVAGMTTAPARATLIDNGTTTIDTDQGLAFLDLTASAGRSYNDVAGQFGVGGDFEGWRYATTSEVSALFTHGGFPGDGDVVSPADANIIPFIEMIGATISIVEVDGGRRVSTDGLFDDSDVDSLSNFVGVGELVYDTRSGQPFFDVSQSRITPGSFGADTISPIVGHFLVRADVPAPASWTILGLGVLALGAIRRLQRS